MLISKIRAYFQGQCLKKRKCAYFFETCLFLSPVLNFEFLAEKIGFFGRENLLFGLHGLLVEIQDSVDRVALVGGGRGGLAP